MNVLGVSGSGRAGGNTAVLVNEILRGAAEAGCRTNMLELARMEVRPCNVCMACKDKHRCIVEDDMSQFYDEAPLTDVLVLASPIYLDHVAARMMTFLQRMYCYIGKGPELQNLYPRPGVKAVLGITYGASPEHAYDYVLDWMRARLKNYFGIETIMTFNIPSTIHASPVGPDHPVVRQAREFGKTLKAGSNE